MAPYWGLFDAAREPKFNWTGPLTEPNHWRLDGIALLVSVLLSLPILAMTTVTLGQAALLATGANVVGAWFATCSPIGTATTSFRVLPSRWA